MAKKEQFLLIKAWNSGFWSAVEHVAGQLLLAELLDRIPIVYWGADSKYSSSKPNEIDAFTLYFLPISKNSLLDLKQEKYTFYPHVFNPGNLHLKIKGNKKDRDNVLELAKRSENVLVSNTHVHADQFLDMIPKSHPAYGKKPHRIYKYLYRKYFKLQPQIQKEIDSFYKNRMANKRILSVHVRGSDKIKEVPNLYKLHKRYPKKINKILKKKPEAFIFLMTDEEKILTQYKQLYGSKLIYTDCLRTRNDQSVHSLPYDNYRKGVEIIKDTYLATKGKYFIGSKSNVSLAVKRLKSWKRKRYILL